MVAKALPSRDLVRQLLHYDPDTGVLTWLHRPRDMFGTEQAWLAWNGKMAGKAAGARWEYKAQTCLYVSLRPRKLKAHRLAWLLHYGEPVPDIIDHVDTDGFNNRITNLRAATKGQNNANSRLRKSNRFGAKGVSRANQPTGFCASIMAEGRRIYLGTFATVEEAAEARRDAAARLHGEFARFD
jgi:hypothetical protein